MASEIVLKPCPFCGGKAKMFALRPGIEGCFCLVARCADNFCIGGSVNTWQTTPERAATVWNRRATDAHHETPSTVHNGDCVPQMARNALAMVKKLFDGRIMWQPDIRKAHEAVNAALAALEGGKGDGM